MKITKLLALVLTITLVFALGISVHASADVGGEITQSQVSAEAYYPTIEEESAAVAAPTQTRSSNTPFFIGALLAVLMFAGVALYCKARGNKGL